MCPDTTCVKKQHHGYYYTSSCRDKYTHDTSEHKCKCGSDGHSWSVHRLLMKRVNRGEYVLDSTKKVAALGGMGSCSYFWVDNNEIKSAVILNQDWNPPVIPDTAITYKFILIDE
jgi:hypothetical protein